MISYWLLKTEANEFSWNDLVEEKESLWDGVKARAAIKNIKQMKAGDLAFIYHTGKERSIIGVAKILDNPSLDPVSNEWVFKISAVEKLPQTVSLKQIKESGLFKDWSLVRLPRLSVVEVSLDQWKTIKKLCSL